MADELATVGATGSSARALVELAIARPDPGGKDHRVFVDGTKLEIIETQDLHEGIDEVNSTPSRLFLLGHRWALVGAEPTRVTVAGTSIDVVLPIATSAALVATELHAVCARPRDETRVSDAYDVFRLLEAHDADGGIASAINDGPRGLAEAVNELAADRLVENAERVVRYLKVYGEGSRCRIGGARSPTAGSAWWSERCVRSDRTCCGRSTSSSTRPSMAGR